jgi:hypothetical protein
MKARTNSQEFLRAWDNVQFIEKIKLTELKTQQLRSYYTNGLVPKELFNYYCLTDDSTWNTKTDSNSDIDNAQ